jgi:lipoic acid synthetase
VITVGQYLKPSPSHHPVEKYYTPEEFQSLEKLSLSLGFKGVAAGPLVRSSFKAGEIYRNL